MKFLVLFFLMFCSCATIPKDLKQPDVALQKVDVNPASFEDLNMIFHFLVHNPNPVPLAVDQVKYNLKINGKPLTEGILDQGLKVGANSSVEVPLPIALKSSQLFSSVSQFLQQGSSKYQINGSVKVGLFSIPFNQNGEVHLSDLKP